VGTRSSTSSSRLWLRLGLLALIVVAIDLGVAGLTDRSAPADFRLSVQAKEGFRSDRPYEAWILGDSLGADAVVPSELGLSAFNWSMYASSPVEWAVLAEDLLRRAPAPRLAIVCVSPQMLLKRPNDGPYARAFVQASDLRLRLTWASIERQDLSALFASGRRRQLLRPALLGAIGRRGRTRVRAMGFDSGYLVHGDRLSGPVRLLPETLRRDSGVWGRQSQAFNALLDRLTAAGCRIVIVGPPIHSEQLRAFEADASTFADTKAVVRAAADRIGARWLDSQRHDACAAYSDREFFDSLHLSHDGAVRFTRSLRTWLGQGLTSADR
jgi:hypothetical protein